MIEARSRVTGKPGETDALKRNYTTRVISTEEEIRAILPDWERCRRDQSQFYIEQRPEWVFDRVGDLNTGKLRVVLLYEGSRIVGVAPLCLGEWKVTWRVRLPGGSRTFARFSLSRAEFYAKSFLSPPESQAQEALFQALLQTGSPCHEMHFPPTAVDSFLGQRLHKKTSGWWRWSPGKPGVHRMIRLAPTFDEYLQKQFSKETRRKLKQEVRRLDREGEENTRLLCITQEAELDSFLEQVERVSLQSWQAHRQGYVVRAAERRAWLSELAVRGWLRCYLLVRGDAPLAFLIGYQSDGAYSTHTTGYDYRLSKRAPGKVMWYRVLEDLHTQKDLQWMDFGPGDWEYKVFLSTDYYLESRTHLIRPGVYTGLVLSLPIGFDRFKAALMSGLARVGLLEPFHRWVRKNFGQ